MLDQESREDVARILREDGGSEEGTFLVNGHVFLRINEDPPVKESEAEGHDRVKVKTRLCRSPEEPHFHFCTHPSSATYPIPITHSVRTIDNHDPLPHTAMFAAPHGIAGYSDWIFVSKPDGLFGSTLDPKVVYVHTKLLGEFAEKVVAHIPGGFILVSSCNDYTIPFNVDLRFGYGNLMHMDAWNALIESKKVVHWFAENHYWTHPKVSTLPIGASMAMDSPDYPDYPKDALPLERRSAKVVVTDKIHDTGAQWEDRRRVLKACEERPEICDSTGGKLFSHQGWAQQVSEHQFIACGHGGGLDPSPKAWESIKIGTIPIIEENPLIDAYGMLPIAWVKDLKAFMLWPNVSTVLANWLKELGPYYVPNSSLRNRTLNQLTGRYWYHVIREKLEK